MNAQIDFLALYRELRIDPDCSPDAFKHAYRRRVSELHPDRSGRGLPGEETLKSLNLGYAAALEFFQAHGRFPGAPATPVQARARRDAPGPAPQRQPSLIQPPTDADRPGPTAARRQRRWLSILLVALVALVLGSQLAGRDGDGDEGAASADPASAWTRPAQAPQPVHADAGALGIGMRAEDVLEVLGAPTDTSEGGRFWHYGPSWVRLSCGAVIDWYSSPLKPLGLSSMHPGSPGEEHPHEEVCGELDPAAHPRR